jgi:EmrB/QacA subfamily drug resistance transporter
MWKDIHMERFDSAAHKGLILFLVCLAQFMVVLDLAIVNVALPSIQADLDMRQSALQWIVIAYGLMLGGFLLLGGRLGDLLGRRRVLLTGLVLFTAASLLAGFAESATVLILARGLQGFGAALMAPSALSILAVTFTEGSERNRSLGIFGAVGGTSASIGVITSGLLTDGPGWRWIFFINIPIGIALIALAWRFLPKDAAHDGARHYDALGAATITSSLILFIYGLNRGVDHGWSSTSTIALFVVAIVLFIAFVRVESRASAPLVPFAALKNRIMVSADLASFLVFGGLFSYFFLGTLLMQQELGYSPTRTGLAWLATSVPAFIFSAITGAKLVGRVGVRKLLVVGPLILAASAAWLTRIDTGANFLTDVFPAFLLAGIAIGLSAPTVQIGALSGVKGEHIGLASGLVETFREIGGAFAIAAVSTVLVSQVSAGGAIVIQGFRYAFYVIVVAALAGAFISSIGFPSRMPVFRPEDEFRPDNELAAETA